MQNKDLLVLKWRDVAAGKCKVLLKQNTVFKNMASLYSTLQIEEFVLISFWYKIKKLIMLSLV